MESVKSGWTKENLQKLLAAMKACIPKSERMKNYRFGLQTIDWNKLTFPPFSSEECQQKWMDVMVKLRKSRSLTELIVQAEEVISDPGYVNKKPPPPSASYYKENSARFKKKHPEMSSTQLLRFSAKKFGELPDEKKTKYLENYSLEMEKHRQQMQEFCPQNKKYSSQSIVRRKKRRKVSAYKGNGTNNEDGLPAKPPTNGYALFCKELSSSVRDVPSVPKNRQIMGWARRWRDLSPTKKTEYIKCSNELKKQYMVKLKSYLERFDEAEQKQILKENGISTDTMLKAKTVKCVTRLCNEPKMPSKAGNVIFCQIQMERLKNEIPNTRERFTKVNKMWRNLSTKQKEQYKEKVNERMKKYAVELQNWFKTLTPQEQKKYKRSNPSKKQYLSAVKVKETRPHPCQPSDSEDEIMVMSSSDQSILSPEDDMEEEEEEEDDDDDDEEDDEDDMFEM